MHYLLVKRSAKEVSPDASLQEKSSVVRATNADEQEAKKGGEKPKPDAKPAS